MGLEAGISPDFLKPCLEREALHGNCSLACLPQPCPSPGCVLSLPQTCGAQTLPKPVLLPSNPHTPRCPEGSDSTPHCIPHRNPSSRGLSIPVLSLGVALRRESNSLEKTSGTMEWNCDGTPTTAQSSLNTSRTDSTTVLDIVPVPDHPCCEEILPNVQTTPPLAQLGAMSSHPGLNPQDEAARNVGSRRGSLPPPSQGAYGESPSSLSPQDPRLSPLSRSPLREFSPPAQPPPPRPHLMPGPARRARASSPLRRGGRGMTMTTPTKHRPSLALSGGGHGMRRPRPSLEATPPS